VEPTLLTREGLDTLLAALDADRERAGEKYQAIRRRLVKFFEWRRCPSPEDFADETIDRVGRRVAQGEQIQASDPGSYFYGVARNVLRESWRRSRRHEDEPLAARPEPTDDPARRERDEQAAREGERRLACLEGCLERLAPESRRLLLEYYEGEKGPRIARRQALADQLGIAPNALRIRVHRLRERLEPCVRACLSQGSAAEKQIPRSATDGRERS
jgi:RNA polymerase sigma factor (sigma-70 family)